MPIDRQQMIEFSLEGTTKADAPPDAEIRSLKDGVVGEDIGDEEHFQPEPINDEKPRLRFFCVGPSTYQIRCPLCQQRADTETVQMGGVLGSISCVLSLFSCCFPIFSLSFVYLCLQSRLKSRRVFCAKCGGYLGHFRRPV